MRIASFAFRHRTPAPTRGFKEVEIGSEGARCESGSKGWCEQKIGSKEIRAKVDQDIEVRAKLGQDIEVRGKAGSVYRGQGKIRSGYRGQGKIRSGENWVKISRSWVKLGRDIEVRANWVGISRSGENWVKISRSGKTGS